MKKWRLIGGVALMFILGVVGGSVGTQFYYHYRAEHIWSDPSARRAFYLNRLTRDLRLNEEQQRQFKTLIDELETKREALYVEIQPELRRIVDQGISRMKEGLSPDQQQKLDRLKAKYEERMKRRRGPPRGFF